jgi:C_GCAxxG_C_C family probable redox protein
MDNPAQFAVARFNEGYACSQSVLSAYASRFDLPLDQAYRIAAAFGAGMARRGEVCGAVTGALMVIGLQAGNIDAQDKTARDKAYSLAEQFMQSFEARHGSILCRGLLGYTLSNPEEYQLAREQGLFENLCPRFVRDSADILADLLKINE